MTVFNRGRAALSTEPDVAEILDSFAFSAPR